MEESKHLEFSEIVRIMNEDKEIETVSNDFASCVTHLLHELDDTSSKERYTCENHSSNFD